VSAVVFHPEYGAVEYGRILHGKPQVSGFGESGGDPYRLTVGGCCGEDLNEVGVACGAGQSCEVSIRGVFPCLRDSSEAGPALSGLESLVFTILRIAEDSGAGHAKFDWAGGDADAAGSVGHGQCGMVAKRCWSGESTDEMGGVDDVVSVFQQQRFGDFAGANLSFGGEGE